MLGTISKFQANSSFAPIPDPLITQRIPRVNILVIKLHLPVSCFTQRHLENSLGTRHTTIRYCKISNTDYKKINVYYLPIKTIVFDHILNVFCTMILLPGVHTARLNKFLD